MTQLTIGALVKWVIEKFGLKIVIRTLDHIVDKYKNIFATRNIIVLGAQETGKSSLINLITTNKPYEVLEGKVIAPTKTAYYAIVDNPSFKIDSQRFRIPEDYGGDPIYRSLWKMAIENHKPNGVIYMVDGRNSGEKLETAIQEMFDDLLSHYNDSNNYGLEALHIFLNFSDEWAFRPLLRNRKITEVFNYFEERISKFPNLQHIEVGISATQLSPNKTEWLEAQAALLELGADLAK